LCAAAFHSWKQKENNRQGPVSLLLPLSHKCSNTWSWTVYPYILLSLLSIIILICFFIYFLDLDFNIVGLHDDTVA